MLCTVISINCHFSGSFMKEWIYFKRRVYIHVSDNISNAQVKWFILFWKNGNLWNLQYTTYGRAARMWRHKIKTLKIHNFCILCRIFVKPSLICFSHCSAFIKNNLSSGWTSPLSNNKQYVWKVPPFFYLKGPFLYLKGTF